MTAIHLLNRSLTSALDDKTSYEAWHEHKLSVSYLHIFSYLAFVKELNHGGKLDDRNTPGVFIGYVEGAKAYNVLDSTTWRMCMVGNMVFDEGHDWAWDKAMDDGSATALRDFTVEYAWARGAEEA